MTIISKRTPQFNVDFITESSSYVIRSASEDEVETIRNGDTILNRVIGFSTKNAMSDDVSAFSMVLTGDIKWDKYIRSNDHVSIRVTADSSFGASSSHPYVMNGLVSDVRKEGEYEDGTLLYRVTGQGMMKVLINFEVGVIQEVQRTLTTGWLPDDESGIRFTGNGAGQIGADLYDFMMETASYTWGDTTLEDYMSPSFSSWEDESLSDPMMFVNYEGSMKQFFDDVSQKPFNEFYEVFKEDGTSEITMRKTPFDPDEWHNLPVMRFASDIVSQESFGQSDKEMHSVYVVQPTNLLQLEGVDFGVYPKFHPDLIDKYGYKRLDAQNRYIAFGDAFGETEDAEGEDVEETGGSEINQSLPTYVEFLSYFVSNNLNQEAVRRNRSQHEVRLKQTYPSLADAAIRQLVDYYITNGSIQADYYEEVAQTQSGDGGYERTVSDELDMNTAKLEKYTQRLFNWYHNNANFYSGEIRLIGDTALRPGIRIEYDDKEQETVWEFYVESVQHEFNYIAGYTTVLGVTRGLANRGADRFGNLWGQSEDFLGGYMGEETLELLFEQANVQNTGDGGDGTEGFSGSGEPGGNVAMEAMQIALSKENASNSYVFGRGRGNTNPLNQSHIEVDCSSFVWWCYEMAGVRLNGGNWMNTDTIKRDSRLQTVSSRGSGKQSALDKAKQGDLIYWDTYKVDGHMAIYLGNGQFIGSQGSTGIAKLSTTSGYWWNHFNGHILRYP